MSGTEAGDRVVVDCEREFGEKILGQVRLGKSLVLEQDKRCVIFSR